MKCPRCGGDSADYGVISFQLGKTRAINVDVRVCSRCGLVFFEKTEEKPGFR
ncbi:hypothetical protein [Archaeoglobus sp.]